MTQPWDCGSNMTTHIPESLTCYSLPGLSSPSVAPNWTSAEKMHWSV
eukprot:CAMPEP_0169226454 /NCGR_PEP_ID=MMETSP1016-20121227/23755_1 /TAXON_ID=342587 /ORGANISM="Karlodinium micrum, Strain CCMP2283" /LENGTH=46 /DNA_ID= /DNA_START= /DNA_END= /DNA_ORIENTATION=